MTEPAVEQEEIALFSDESHLSLRSLLGSCPATLAAIDAIPIELHEKTEYELVKHPDDTLRRLKISLWNEYKRCVRNKLSEMSLTNVQFGVCSRWWWQKNVTRFPDVLAWLIKPPTSEILVQEELLELGYRKLRRILKANLVEKRYWKDRTGEVHVERRFNVTLAKEMRAIVEMLQNRLHGSAIQRQSIESKSLHVNVGGTQEKSIDAQLSDISLLLGKIEQATEALPPIEQPILEGVVEEQEAK